MAKLPLTDATTIKNETIPGANTATRVGSLFEEIVNFVNASQIPDNIITPPTLVAQADDYNPAGFADCNMIRQAIAGDQSISGFLAPPAGVNRIIRINQLGVAGDRLGFLNNNAASLPANRILLRDNGNREIRDNETAVFWYDHTSQRWRPMGRIG